MKNSIVKKVFFSTVFLLVLILCLQLLFQMTLMPSLYSAAKTRKTEGQFQDFLESYNQTDGDSHAINELTEAYMGSYAAPILVVDKNGRVINDAIFESMNYLVVEENGRRIQVLLGNRVDEAGRLYPEFEEWEINHDIAISDGAFLSEKTVSLDGASDDPLVEKMEPLTGRIVDTHFLQRDQGIYSFQSEKLLREANALLAMNPNRQGEFEFREAETGLDIRIRYQRQADQSWIIGLYMIEDLSETFLVLNDFYLAYFVIALLLVFVLSIIYSRWITRPLHRLLKDTDRIARLDFSQKSQIKTGDELERLSDNLNRIAENMETNIALLKEEARSKEKNERRMRELLANLSHEFKTPLGIMSGFVEMMEVTDENKEYYLKTIGEEIEKLDGLTRETLLLCESEQVSFVLSRNMVLTKQLTESSKFSRQVDDKNLVIQSMVEDHYVFCDSHKIQIVMDNLMSNAINYSKRGGTIRVKAILIDQNIRFSIENDAPELSEEDLSMIWDKYYRLDKSRNKQFGGSGLGLSIVKNILQAHDCEYGARKNDEAVEFYFTLPLWK